MNVMNVEEEYKGSPQTFLQDLFIHQKELMGKYVDIEGQHGIGLGLLKSDNGEFNLNDLSLDSPKLQYVLKDFSWRVIEELAEALECKGIPDQREHMIEELADSMHFLIELMILSGISIDRMCSCFHFGSTEFIVFKNGGPFGRNIDKAVTYFVLKLGTAMNCLKNKPWKQTQILTDQNKFYYQLANTWFAYCHVVGSFGVTTKTMMDYYIKKFHVNKFRQRSQY